VTASEQANVAPVILAFDGSDDARQAVAEAGPLLGGGHALVVHVWEPFSAEILRNPMIRSPGPLVAQAEEIDAAGLEAAHRLVDEGVRAAREAGFDAEALCIRSENGVWSTIVQLAEERGARAVVIGSRGLSAIRSALLGSVSSKVIHHCSRPVLVMTSDGRAAGSA
jgi:nucleotide-binding universal stress UspA family protein